MLALTISPAQFNMQHQNNLVYECVGCVDQCGIGGDTKPIFSEICDLCLCLAFLLTASVLDRTEKDLPEFEATGFIYDVDDFTEVCVISKPIIYDEQSLTVYVPSDDDSKVTKMKVKPYPRREDPSAMEQVTSVQVIRGNSSSIHPPACEITHDVPALLYSFAGFAENPFHAFNELIIPLFITSHHFESKVQFVLTDFRGKWYWKYTRVLKELTSFENIGIDPVKKVHCFPSAVVGLRYFSYCLNLLNLV